MEPFRLRSAEISHRFFKALGRPEVRSQACQWTLRRTEIKPQTSRPFSTSRPRRAIAAAEIDFDSLPPPAARQALARARIVPASPSYFTGKPAFTDDLLNLQALLRKYQTLPIVKPGLAPRVAWRTHAEYKGLVDEPVKAAKYHKIVELLHRLNHIHPSLVPEEVTETLQFYKRAIQPFENVTRPSYVDEYGRSVGVGRRKASTAKVWLVEGEGEVMINGKSLNQTFGRVHDRESAIWALKATDRIERYNVWASVKGGGLTGQAEALTLGVAKALLVHEPLLKPALRRAGCITRDPRRVERKKPGKLKARKMPAWVKR